MVSLDWGRHLKHAAKSWAILWASMVAGTLTPARPGCKPPHEVLVPARMAHIDIRRNHSLGLERAREAAVHIAKRLEDTIDVRYRWEGDDLMLERTGATGRFHVRAEDVHVEIDLGFALRPLRGRVTKRVHDYLDEYFSG